MSEEMAATETSEKAEVNGDEALPAASSSSSVAVEPSTVAEVDAPVASDEPSTSKDDAAIIQQENTDDDKKADEESKSVEESKSDEQIVETVKKENDVEVKKRKRATSPEGSDADDGEEFRGFDTSVVEEMETSIAEYSNIIDRLESDINTSRASLSRTLGTVTASPRTRNTPASNHQTRNNPKRLKLDSDASRPSSALSSRSEGDGATSNTDASSASSPSMRGRRATTEMSSPLLRVPLDKGWKRELVYRANVDAYNRRNADIYYYTPAGKKLRSTREVGENLSGTGLTLENFSFFKEPLGIDDPDKEVIRDARLMRRIDTPVATPPTPVEGKRAPKPKAPKGASPEPATITSPPAKIKVKSMGSRLSGTATPPKQAAAKQKQVKKEKPTTTTTTDNNNTTWKKPSDKPRRGLSNGTTPTSTGASSPRRRKKIDEDHFTHFYNKSQEMNYDCVTHIFQYLGMRELAQCARVCKLWRDIATTPALWRHVRMKNSHVSDWAGLCALLKRHGTTRLDLRKMLLPSQDNAFWEQFAANICTLHMLERLVYQ